MNAAADVDIAAHEAAFDGADVVGDLHVTAHALDADRPLHVFDVHVARHALHPRRPARSVEVEIAADCLCVDSRLARHRDLEIDAEALAAEEIEPAALLLVQVRLDEDVVALLLDPNLDVLEQPLRAVGAPALHALARDDSYLARFADANGRLSGNVLHTEARHPVDREGLLDRLLVQLAVVVVHPDERRAD